MSNPGNEIERLSRSLSSSFASLSKTELAAWRREGRELVSWMNTEADDMAKVEKDVAISKVTGGSAAIVGGVMTGVGLATSFITLGLAAPIAVAGVVLTGAGAATSTGGDIAQLSISHMKTYKIKERCETFAQRTEGVLSILVEVGNLMDELYAKLRQQKSSANVKEVVRKSGQGAANMVNAGMQVHKVMKIVYQIEELQRGGVIFGAEFLRIARGSITASGGTISRALSKGAGTAVGIGFGIWDVVDASGTLHNGGSHASLIRDNAIQINNTINEIDKALHMLGL